MHYEFGNDTLNLRFESSNGSLLGFAARKGNLELIGEPRLSRSFRLLLPLPELRHNYLEGSEQKLSRFETAGDRCELTWEGLKNKEGEFDITVKSTFEFGEDPGEVQVRTSVINGSQNTVEEVWSPMLGGFRGLGDRAKTSFMASLWDGGFPAGAQGSLARFPSDTPYWNEEFDYFELAYPWEMTMQWVDFYNEEISRGLYLASHDKSAQVTFFHFELRPGMVQRDTVDGWPTSKELSPGEPVGMTCSIAKLPFVGPGKHWTSAPACIRVHGGDWHAGADRYRRWVDTWLRFPTRPGWVRKGLAMQSTVMSWPDDLISYRFSDIPRLAREAKKFGVNAIQLTGFQKGGLDRGYPDYTPDPRLGSEEELYRGIREANRIGVKVLLFVNVQVADSTTKEFGERLTDWSAKDRFGKERRLGYGMHTLAEKNKWGYRQLALMCPSAKPFQELLVRQFGYMALKGANGIQIDKLGEYGLCYESEHGHKPAEAFSKGIVQVLGKLRDLTRDHDSDFLIGGEACYDYCLPYIDFSYMRLHRRHLPVLRYTFPEALVTQCVHQFDFESVNNCLREGYVVNAEVYNLRKTLSSAPKIGSYIKEILRMRSELSEFLWEGRFTDVIGASISGDTEGILYGVHVDKKSGRRAVVLMNTSERTRNVRLSIDETKSRNYRVYLPFRRPYSQAARKMIPVDAKRVAVAVEEQ